MLFKIDLEKAYDRLSWIFIADTLRWFGFPELTVALILSCFSSSSMAVLWNGEICDSFKPERGVRS